MKYIQNIYINEAIQQKDIAKQLHILRGYDKNTFKHCIRTADMAMKIGGNIGLTKQEMKTLATASLLHDIGKIYVPLEILNKPEKLTSEEFEIVKNHTIWGATHLENAGFNKTIQQIVNEHHENFDGSGYPNNKCYDELHKLSCILRIADSFDAMHSKRPYKKRRPVNEIHEELLMDNGHCYNPNIIIYI